MSRKCIVRLNYGEVRKYIRGESVQAMLKERADNIAAAAGGTGYVSEVVIMPTRAISSVYTETDQAIEENSEDNSLLRAVTSGGN